MTGQPLPVERRFPRPTGETAGAPFPHAVLFDMDGTLVDTEPYWIEAEFALAETYGGTWSHEHALNLVGNDLIESGRYIREHMGIGLEPAQIVEELLDGVIERVERQVPWRPGAVELLADLLADPDHPHGDRPHGNPPSDGPVQAIVRPRGPPAP